MKTLKTLFAAILFCTFTLGASAQKMMPLPNDLSKEVDFKGKVLFAKKWMDDNGANFIIFTKPKPTVKKGKGQYSGDITSQYIYAYHYISGRDGYELSRKITDFELNCEFDLDIFFIEKSLTITDIDKDGYAEITFVYHKTCASDISPKVMKLMMLENGKKYAIRGTTKIEGFEGGGECNVDKTLKKAPKGFYKHAQKIWDENNTELF